MHYPRLTSVSDLFTTPLEGMVRDLELITFFDSNINKDKMVR